MPQPVLAFLFEPFLVFLVWLVMLVMNLWMFQKTKAQGNLLMTIGAGSLSLSALLMAFESWGKFQGFWLPFLGAILLVVGFYLTAKPVVDVHIEALKKKIQDATAEKKGEASDGDDAKSDDA